MNAPAEASEATELAWYVYGVVDPDAVAPAAGGVEGDVDVVRQGEVAALVSRVALAEYGDEAVRARLEDPAWLEAKARAHEAVLSAALRGGAVVPFRFLTLYRDEADLRAFLDTRGGALREVLERLRGKVELGVKAFVDADALTRALTEEDSGLQEPAGAPPGRSYLLRRQRERALADRAANFRAECARACHARLAELAEEAVANPPQPRELSGREEEMLLNGAYLVPAGDERVPEAVAALGDEYGRYGVSLDLTGPWPPFNFVPRET